MGGNPVTMPRCINKDAIPLALIPLALSLLLLSTTIPTNRRPVLPPFGRTGHLSVLAADFSRDRDWYAAINLALAVKIAVSACGASKSAICLGSSDASKQEKNAIMLATLRRGSRQASSNDRTYAATLWIGATTGGLPLQNAISGCFA